MGRHSDSVRILASLSGAGAAVRARPLRHPYVLPLFAFWVALAIVLVTVIAPNSPAQAAILTPPAPPSEEPATQHLVVQGEQDNAVVRDGYSATKRVVRAAPVVGTPDPGSAQAIAYDMLQARGWGDDEFSCLVSLWNRESGWNVYATNKSSGAYGIPQALPGSKMATAGADWQTNAATQITWGLGYITARYGTPCGAWSSFQSKGWY